MVSPAEPVVEVRGLRFIYPGQTEPALRGTDFQIPAGEIFGFLGPNGAGKRTTQKVLIGLSGATEAR